MGDQGIRSISYEDCSLVLVLCHRQWNIEKIVAANVVRPWKEIVLFSQEELGLSWQETHRWSIHPCISFYRTLENTCSAARCMGALLAKSNIICTQDDDYLVTDRGWQILFRSWNEQEVSVLQPDWVREELPLKPYADLGYGSLFDRRAMQLSCRALQDCDLPYDLLGRRADKAWTTFWGQTQRVPAWRAHIERLLNPDYMMSESDETSLNKQPRYQEEVARVVGAAMAARLLYCKSSTHSTDPSRIEWSL